MSDDPFQSPEWLDYEERVVKGMLPKLEGSAMALMMAPKGPTDLQFAVQLGLSIMLNKPIITVALEGVELPPKLEQFSDYIVRGDLSTPEGRKALAHAIAETAAMIG